MKSPELGRRSPGPYQDSDLHRRVQESHEKHAERKAARDKGQSRCFGRSTSGTEGESLVDSACFDNCSSCCEIGARKIAVFFQKAGLYIGKGFCWLAWGICFCSPRAQNSIKSGAIDKLQGKLDELEGLSDAISNHERAEAAYEEGDYLEGLGHDIQAGVAYARPRARSAWQNFKNKFK
ncbi:hypothetical protein [Kistimonas asteriae]|uniref:hypothetical protein n=1 Tax=Kistimonas asteriae TaxID=517724 RepID=UPI001BA8D5C0|nr:hypothetical protein [Kistimonas asteriae]